ncbi:MAG: ATP-binding protein [Candidatus Aenigmarchaeota archaeon]|nr:ATP-binding protein [Candidatus Aenigmarchaeota archaeon]
MATLRSVGHAPQHNDVQQVMELIHVAGLDHDPRVLSFFNLALRTGNWRPVIQVVNMMRPFNSDRPPHPFDVPPPEAVVGDILVGYVVNPDWSLGFPVFLKREHFDRHVVNVGAPGTGKSVTNRSLALQLEQLGDHFIFLDSENEVWDLPAYAPPGRIVRCTIKEGQFKRNLFEPLPGESFADVDARMRDIDREVWVGDGGVNLGTEIGFEMYQRQGVFTVREFHEELVRRRAKMNRAVDMRRAQYLEGLINRFTGLVLHLAGTYDALEGFSFGELAHRSWVFNLQGMASDTRVFFPIELLTAFDDYKAKLGDADLRNVLFLEEGHRFVKSAGHAETILGEPLLFDTVRTGRKRKLGVVTTTQEAKDLPSVISGNSATHLYYGTTDGESIKRIASDHSLTLEQARLFQELPMRFAMMRHPEVAKPFLVRMPEISFNIPVTEEQIAEMMKAILAALKWTPASARNGTTPAARNEAHHKEGDAAVNGEPARDEKGEQESQYVDRSMDSTLLDYLQDIAATPFEAATDRDTRLGVSHGAGNGRRDKLGKLGLIREYQVRLVRRGSPTKLIEVTDKGWALLEQYKRKAKRPSGRGSFIHQFWQHKIAERITASLPNANVTIEDQTTGKAVDVLARIENQVIGTEISETTRPEDELRNIQADLKFCDVVFVLAEGEKHLQSIKELASKRLSGEDLRHVRFSTLLDFYLSPPPFNVSLL